MLSIKKFVLLLCFMGALGWGGEESYSKKVNWLLEDALDEDLIILDISKVVTPSDFKEACDYYKKGDYRLAAAVLENLLNLCLPDGRTDFISFVAAECYRKLEMLEKSKAMYQYVVTRFPESDKTPPAYFRLLQFAYKEKNGAMADSVSRLFELKHKIHPLFNAVQYTVSKLYFSTERYGEAYSILVKIPKTSSHYFQAQFLASLCLIQLNNSKQARYILEYLRQNALDIDIIADANTLIGDILFTEGDFDGALGYYQLVGKKSFRYDYAQIKMARIYLKKKQYQKARDIARVFVGRGGRDNYFFEMASIVEQTYSAQKEIVKAAKIRGLINEQNINIRLSFDVSDELIRIYEMIRSWKCIEYDALEQKHKKLVEEARDNIQKLGKLHDKCVGILYDIGIIPDPKVADVPELAQRRYLYLLKKNIINREDTLRELRIAYGRMASEQKKEDSTGNKILETRKIVLDSTILLVAQMKDEYEKLKKVYLESGSEAEKFGKDMQVKYIDWAFLGYVNKKKHLDELNKKLSLVTHTGVKSPHSDSTGTHARRYTVKVNADSLALVSEREKSIKFITDDRIRLIDYIGIFLDANYASSYNPQILFRLAELYFDEASEDFNKRLDEYEKRAATGDTADLKFPEYNLDKTLKIYTSIIESYPYDALADNALFFKALALKKLGKDKEATDEFIRVITKYPESEFYVEANMNIGNYYFDNPTVDSGKGYTYAEEAYRRILRYQEHPQFIQAVYRLGWCYYMQDLYEDAIAVFKYLVKEVRLDFDLSRADEKQVSNPLMREEAEDYLAISFDESGDLDAAIKFLNMINSVNYSAKVFKRMGELREEDMDYDKAIAVYRRLIDEYGVSSIAPDAAESIIRILESKNNHAQAMAEREMFFQRYARGSAWNKENSKMDSARVAVVDSMAIANGLYVADALYRYAEEHKDPQYYIRAVENYERLINAYPKNIKAAEALWNLAAIQETKMGNNDTAYTKYITFSRMENADATRREQAALNAIAICQKQLPVDSLVKQGVLDTSALRAVEASHNYLKLFPDGKALSDVIMNMAAIYYNRRMFNDAIATYKLILDLGPGNQKFIEALFLSARSFFGKEEYITAAGYFSKVWTTSPDEVQKKEAYKLLLQSKYLYAKKLYDSGDYEQAALEYGNIDKMYPGSEYGDITIFNAAEAYEKTQDMQKACRMYFQLYEKYPGSKLAPDALFNAAADYEKIEKFDKAAEMYEIITASYINSPKAKDALFNVGFCYEKLGKAEKMAESNERFSRLFPGEKDVESMMVRTAEYYYKNAQYEKARKIYRNYIASYGKSERTVEAYYYIGKCYEKDGDANNASMGFDQAEAHHKRLVEAGLPGNTYFAAEAAYALATVKQKNYSDVAFTGAPEQLKKVQKEKTDLLAAAVQAYQRVIKYKSERMFQAAFHIGEMYEEYANAWSMQRLDKMDPIKLAVAEKDIYVTSAQLLKKSIEPFKKVIELSSGFNSLGAEQKKWIDSAKTSLINDYRQGGVFMLEAINSMQGAPIPADIQKKPLFLFQYKKQLLETLEPLKVQVRDYYLGVYKELVSLHISEKAEDKSLTEFNRITFLIPNEYDQLSEDILARSEELTKSMNDNEKEDLLFQLEDLVYEIQDKALFDYEEALALAKKENKEGNLWIQKIYQKLARLSPEKYGKDFFFLQVFTTNEEWICNPDSVRYWNTVDPFSKGWVQVSVITQDSKLRFATGEPYVIWGSKDSSHVYLYKNMFLNGNPRNGRLYFASNGPYKFYLNEKLLLADTARSRTLDKVDSIQNIGSILKGGDNIIAIEAVQPDSSKRGLAMIIVSLLDTTQHFQSSAMIPDVKIKKLPKKTSAPAEQPGDTLLVAGRNRSATPDAAPVADSADRKYDIQEKKELMNAITAYNDTVKSIESVMRKERVDIQKLHIKLDALTSRLKAVEKEIAELRQSDTLQIQKK